jgi:hypothetical protein
MLNETRGLTSVAAWGDWHPDVASGKVCVYATQDGRLGVGGKYFMVPSAEYVRGLRIDPKRHAEAVGFTPMNGLVRAKSACGGVANSRATEAGACEAAESPAAFRGGALPWNEVFRKLGIETSGGGRS